MSGSTFKVAVPQQEPCWLDPAAGVIKTIKIMEEAAAEGAKLIAFGELWLPGYPSFLYGGKMNDVVGHGMKYFKAAINLEGPELAEIAEAADRLNLITHVGFTEREGNTLYMSNVIFDENGKRLLHRRKIKPSHYERVLHGDGDAEGVMNCVETSIGRVSVLNCWEHFQPLLKYHTYSQRPLIHISAWPMLHPHGGVEQWSHCDESGKGVTRTVAIEAGAFVLCASNVLTAKGMEINKVDTGAVVDAGHIQPGGGFAPDGRQISRKISDSEETILYVDIDSDLQAFNGLVQDTVGHYSRPDIFTLVVNVQPRPRVIYNTAAPPIPSPSA
ncbi:carbon-nitrogen hydrolase [Meredithblackwellia eburnea MCA 4105]